MRWSTLSDIPMRASACLALPLALGALASPRPATNHRVSDVFIAPPHRSAPREVEVVGTDYAFRAPRELPPGHLNHCRAAKYLTHVARCPPTATGRRALTA